MRALVFGLLLAAAPAAAAAPGEAAVAKELAALMTELDAAVQRHDRAALERIFAPEFVWVHAFGYVDDRATHIAQELATEKPPGLPGFDFGPPNQLIVTGDVAILRQPTRPTRNVERLWSSAVYRREGGRWRIVQIQGTVMQPPQTIVTLPAAALDALAGRYRNDNGAINTIRRDGDALLLTTPAFPPRTLRPIAPDRFVNKAGTVWTFGAQGYTVKFPNGREGKAVRIGER